MGQHGTLLAIQEASPERLVPIVDFLEPRKILANVS